MLLPFDGEIKMYIDHSSAGGHRFSRSLVLLLSPPAMATPPPHPLTDRTPSVSHILIGYVIRALGCRPYCNISMPVNWASPTLFRPQSYLILRSDVIQFTLLPLCVSAPQTVVRNVVGRRYKGGMMGQANEFPNDVTGKSQQWHHGNTK